MNKVSLQKTFQASTSLLNALFGLTIIITISAVIIFADYFPEDRSTARPPPDKFNALLDAPSA